jgi:exonuclease III
MLFNARSLNGKLFDVQYLLYNEKTDILCITETWLQPALPNCLIVFYCDHSVFRTDRSSDWVGGGVCILTSNATVKATSVPITAKFLHLALCAVDISLDKVKLRLFVCYRPSSSNTDVHALKCVEHICAFIYELFSVDSPVIICGDFNLPNIDWCVDDGSLCCDSTCDGVFSVMYYNQGLCQFVSMPPKLDSFLDLVFSSDHFIKYTSRSH